jgi:hypothetical protein
MPTFLSTGNGIWTSSDGESLCFGRSSQRPLRFCCLSLRNSAGADPSPYASASTAAASSGAAIWLSCGQSAWDHRPTHGTPNDREYCLRCQACNAEAVNARFR